MRSLVILLLGMAPVTAGETSRVIHKCGISLTLPATWSIAPPTDRFGTSCYFGLRPRGWGRTRERSELDVSEDAISVEVEAGTLASLYNSGAVWRDESGRLCQRGYAGCGEAREVKTDCCTAVLGEADVRRRWKSGAAAGIDLCPAAFVVGKGRIAHIFAAPELEDAALFEAIVRSVRIR
jgi:hypothetical protein